VETTEQAPKQSKRRWVVIGLFLVILVIGVVATVSLRSSPATLPAGPEGVELSKAPDLAPASSTLHGEPVGPIQCVTESQEKVGFHTHTYVAVFVDGEQRRIPGGVGITQPWLAEKFPTGTYFEVGPYNCLYWIHTHTADNIVHVEAPSKGIFTLGQLFAVWNQPLSSTQVGPAKGKVVVIVNGKRAAGDITTVPLTDQATIQINVGDQVVPFEPKTFKVTGQCGQGTKSCKTPIK
jgi:hypothetical protein